MIHKLQNKLTGAVLFSTMLIACKGALVEPALGARSQSRIAREARLLGSSYIHRSRIPYLSLQGLQQPELPSNPGAQTFRSKLLQPRLLTMNLLINQTQARAFSQYRTKDEIDVLDEQGCKTGEVLPREKIHRLGKIHRAIHLYLFDKSNNLLLQRRSNTVDHYPGMYSISVTGHVDAGEESSEAVRRELKEELGIDSEGLEIEFLFSFRQDATLGPTYIDRQINDIYVCWADFKIEDITIDQDEVSEVKLVPFAEFEAMVNYTQGELAPVYAKECAQLIPLLRKKNKL